MTREYEEYLAHYGIKGQKWGVRNWQNEDGTYNDAGRERYWGGGSGRQPAVRLTPQSSDRRVAMPQAQSVRQLRREKAINESEAIRVKQRRAKMMAIAAGISLTAALAYVGHRNHVVSNFKEFLGKRAASRYESRIRKKYGDVVETYVNPLNYKNWNRRAAKQSERYTRDIARQYRAMKREIERRRR